ncbi:hypothetical protein BMS3Bbin09_00988 [bacterium BMS3Bbin09]|nr:hypothetical protein BMS3Bbin09_00988 [bacterium BMS3Bbin09]
MLFIGDRGIFIRLQQALIHIDRLCLYIMFMIMVTTTGITQSYTSNSTFSISCSSPDINVRLNESHSGHDGK